MRRIPLCLFVPFVLACGPEFGPNHFTIGAQGTVTAADDGSPVAGAVLEVKYLLCFRDCTTLARDTTDASGNYSLSFVVDPCLALLTVVTHPGFLVESVGGVFDSRQIDCTEELQIIDIQLERIPPPEPAGD